MEEQREKREHFRKKSNQKSMKEECTANNFFNYIIAGMSDFLISPSLTIFYVVP